MFNQSLRETLVRHVFPRVQMPAQYLGGELNMVRKDHREVRGKLCMAFPDAYIIGMSHHGLQVLYTLMNGREDWACERAFCPWPDMEQQLRNRGLPLYSLENFTPLHEFDVFGFTMQYEVCTSNVLTMLDLGRIPLHSEDRTMADPLVLAGGPCAQNPEPMAPFVDVFVTGDGEPSLPAISDLWLELREQCKERGGFARGEAGRKQREEALARIATSLPYAYVPRFYEPEYLPSGRLATINRTRSDVPETIEPCVIGDLDATPLPTRPIVPFVECVHDRISIEIMRGCPWQCRFCQSTVIKRPLRVREVETIVQAALESYRNTGYQEISILSLSTSDYPYFEQLVKRLHEVFRPLGVSISVPSLRVNEMLKSVTQLIDPKHRNSLTLAPEVARDDMREQIRKKISNKDLYDGCREAFHNGFEAVKLYFLCGLPGEREVDLDGIIEMSDTISRIGKEETGRFAKVTASVSNFVPKAHTPYQWNGMQSADYFSWAHRHLRKINRNRSVVLKCHDTETSLLEGVLSRGDRRTAAAVELAWRNGSRMESWREHMKPEIWWNALEQTGINSQQILHEPSEIGDRLPWDHINVKKGRAYLEKEQNRAVIQLTSMADAK